MVYGVARCIDAYAGCAWCQLETSYLEAVRMTTTDCMTVAGLGHAGSWPLGQRPEASRCVALQHAPACKYTLEPTGGACLTCTGTWSRVF